MAIHTYKCAVSASMLPSRAFSLVLFAYTANVRVLSEFKTFRELLTVKAQAQFLNILA